MVKHETYLRWLREVEKGTASLKTCLKVKDNCVTDMRKNRMWKSILIFGIAAEVAAIAEEWEVE